MPHLYVDMAEALGAGSDLPAERAVPAVLGAIRQLSADVGIPRNLKELVSTLYCTDAACRLCSYCALAVGASAGGAGATCRLCNINKLDSQTRRFVTAGREARGL